MAANKVYVCKEHDNCECKHYCKDCEKNICLVCTLIGDHSQHDHCTIPQAVTQCQEGVKEISDAIDALIESLDNRYDKITTMKTKVQEQGKHVRNKIYEHYNELDHILREQREQVKQLASDVVTRKEKVLALQLTAVEQAKSEMLTLKDMKDAYQITSEQDILSVNAAKQKQIIEHCLQKLKSNHEKINFEPEEKDDIELVFLPKSLFPQLCHLSVSLDSQCVPTKSELLVPTKIYVKKIVTATLLTRDASGHYCSKGGSQVSMQLETSSGKISILEVKDNRNGSYVTSFTADQAGVARLLVSVNGLQIKKTPYRIVAYTNYQSYRYSKKILNDDKTIGCPSGITAGKFGVLAVADSDNHCVHVFDGGNQLIRKVGSHGKGDGQLSSPEGIIFDDNNHLYVADSSNNRIQKFDMDGNYLLQFGNFGTADGQLFFPYGITVHDGKVYVSENRNHRISVFKNDGQFCVSFGFDQLSSPYGIAINVDNQLLVADYTNNCLVTFTLDGENVGKFRLQGECKGLKNPHSIFIDVNGFVLVTDSKSYISVFDHTGTFTHSFGSTGNSNYPNGIALGSNGNIYVSDTSNKSIQIFTASY